MIGRIQTSPNPIVPISKDWIIGLTFVDLLILIAKKRVF